MEQASRIRRRCGKICRYAIATRGAKYNFGPDLAIVLNKPLNTFRS
ncbi:hypothetical protein [Enterobacter cloacae]